MKARALIAVVVVLSILQSCRYGTTVESFPPARTPKGVIGTIVTNRGGFQAELIEVRGDGILIRADLKFRLLPYSTIVSFRFGGVPGGGNVGNRRELSPPVRERLRLVSRFPQGLTPELLRQLLEANSQAELERETP